MRTLPWVTVALAIGLSACSLQRAAPNATDDRSPLSGDERIAHVLTRLTFGARPGDAERVRAVGIDRWIDAQLRPEIVPDTVLPAILANVPAWAEPTASLAVMVRLPPELEAKPIMTLVRDTMAQRLLAAQRQRIVGLLMLDSSIAVGKIARAEAGNRQLEEVVVDFWENHFSVFNAKMPSSDALTVWDRDVIRPRAMGKFRELLGATAHSAAMLYYLDNWQSRRGALNENYARELMELHTLGVDGGYTQRDVENVARAFTGWTIERGNSTSRFVFRREMHDTAAKVVLGHVLPAGRGIEDGEEVLDILSSNLATARFVATKLARRFVNDDPPKALIEQASRTFERTGGDIAQTLRTIVTSKEFFARPSYRAKVKTPIELVVSVNRALGAPADTSMATYRLIGSLGQRTFGYQTPEGWPERGSAWINTGTIIKRVEVGRSAAEGKLPSLAPGPSWTALADSSAEVQVAAIIRGVFAGAASPVTRAALINAGSDGAGDARLRQMLAVALASPEFQRR